MAFVFHRRSAIPMWALAFFAVALAAPASAALPVMAVTGTAMIAVAMLGLAPWSPASPAAVRIRFNGQRRRRREVPVVCAGTRVRTIDTPNPSTAEEALDLVRMDDDGGWQMARPPV